MASQSRKPTDRVRQYEKREKRKTIRALHAAVKKGDIQVVQKMLTPDVDVNFHYNSESALQIAVCAGDGAMCELLINNNADVDKHTVEDNSLLNMAAWRGHTEVVEILLRHNADTTRSNNHGSTPLNTAAYCGFADIVETFVKSGCYLEKPNKHGQTPLGVAAREGHAGVVSHLIKAKANLNCQDNERRTPLILAAEHSRVQVVKQLLEAGCDKNMHQRYGYTALYLAAKSGYLDIVQVLVKAGVNLDKSDTKNQTPFYVAVEAQHRDIVSVLAKAGCNVNIAEREMLQAPIHAGVKLACAYFGGPSSDTVSLVQTLLEVSCDLNVSDKAGWTPLHQSAYSGEPEICEMLLEAGAKTDCFTGTNESLLHAAVFGNKAKIMKLFIDKGCDVNAVNNRNELPVYVAIAHRANVELIRLLLDAGSKTDVCEKDMNQSPLFVAIQHDFIEAVELLIKAGADINLCNDNGDSPLFVACDKGNEVVVNLLLQQPGIEVNSGITHIPLHAAAAHGYLSIAEQLLQSGADVNKMTDLCVTALYLAAERDCLPVAKLLIRWGANPSAPHDVSLPRRCCFTYSDPHPHLELEPVYCGVQNNNFYMIKLVLIASPKMPYNALRWLRDIVFRTGYAQEVRLTNRQILQLAEFFTSSLVWIRSLHEECRARIRERLGCNPASKVALLPVPAKVKDYLLLSDVPDLKS